MNKRIRLAIAIALSSMAIGWTADSPVQKVSMAEARAIALNVYSGKIESEELENEHAMSVYSFDIRRGRHGRVHEIQISENTGKVVSHTIETVKQEADEKASEQGTK